MNKQYSIFERINKDTIFDKYPEFSIGYDTKLEIAQLIHKRKIHKISQEKISELSGFSIATIKRFELLKVDSLVLFNDYRHHLDHLSSKIKPNWI